MLNKIGDSEQLSAFFVYLKLLLSYKNTKVIARKPYSLTDEPV